MPAIKYATIFRVAHHPMLPFGCEIQSKGNIEPFYLTFSLQKCFKRSNRRILYALWIQIL